MHGHARGGHELERDRVGAAGERALGAQPAGGLPIDAGAVQAIDVPASVVPVAGPAGAHQHDVPGGDRDAGATCRPLKVVGVDDKVVGQRLEAFSGSDIEQDAAAKDRLDGVDMVHRQAGRVRLAADGVGPAVELSVQRKVAQSVDVRSDMPAERERIRGRADSVAGGLPVRLVEAVQERRVVRVVGHAGVVRLRQIDDARLVEALQQVLHSRAF